MAKELLIVFLYDTELNLREEEDPQKAVVYFHPSWVSANQRMALCGQLIGVTQFLTNSFAFPHVISLQSGKFAMKKIGRYILCVGTDRNIPDWILEKRCEMLYNALIFFHGNLTAFFEDCEPDVGLEKLTNAMEVYLPTLLFAGNIFGSNPTIRLPKSASSIFLETAQILECLQDKAGVYGGAIFYQNKVVMSQLSTDITKQIVVMDPFRIKIPVDTCETSFHLPVGVQLLIVYIDKNDLKILEDQKVPSLSSQKTYSQEKDNENQNTSINNKPTEILKIDRSKISTVLEEESELDHSLKVSNTELAKMPDIVKDTVKIVNKNENLVEQNNKFHDIRVESYIVDPLKKFANPTSFSVENLEVPEILSSKYCSFKNTRNSGELSEKTPEKISVVKNDLNSYYNTISDPVYPWFRANGLPASKALHDDRIAFYCHDIGKVHQINVKADKLDETIRNPTDPNPRRPTSIQLNLEDSKKKRKNRNFNYKKDIPELNQEPPLPSECNIPVTPLMSKLSMLDLSESKQSASCSKLPTPSTSRTFAPNENASQTEDHPIRPPRRKKIPQEGKNIPLQKSVLFVYGYQNVSLYLLLNVDCGKEPDLINFLWTTCYNSIPDLERHFQQCFESIPQTQSLNAANDSYGFISIHSEWETLQKNGVWTASQMELVNSLHEDFNQDATLTDITVRMKDSVVYGHQLGDSQVFYQQTAPPVAGLPMPSDLMGVIPLKAKRRLERDHGVLLL